MGVLVQQRLRITGTAGALARKAPPDSLDHVERIVRAERTIAGEGARGPSDQRLLRWSSRAHPVWSARFSVLTSETVITYLFPL